MLKIEGTYRPYEQEERMEAGLPGMVIRETVEPPVIPSVEAAPITLQEDPLYERSLIPNPTEPTLVINFDTSFNGKQPWFKRYQQIISQFVPNHLPQSRELKKHTTDQNALPITLETLNQFTTGQRMALREMAKQTAKEKETPFTRVRLPIYYKKDEQEASLALTFQDRKKFSWSGDADYARKNDPFVLEIIGRVDAQTNKLTFAVASGIPFDISNFCLHYAPTPELNNEYMTLYTPDKDLSSDLGLYYAMEQAITDINHMYNLSSEERKTLAQKGEETLPVEYYTKPEDIHNAVKMITTMYQTNELPSSQSEQKLLPAGEQLPVKEEFNYGILTREYTLVKEDPALEALLRDAAIRVYKNGSVESAIKEFTPQQLLLLISLGVIPKTALQ